ncbi:lytic polysaccharide monooxygenase [Streptomyces sp. NPDC013740]|uniref:lytic polysaccharide monooxygenase n=1 Tax=Streptomyces sp. NPDC013740 TaxID=3364867 RepID=UPI0036FE8773
MASLRTPLASVVTASAVLVLSGLGSGAAFAHGSMTDPVSRVAACYAEGPESPDSTACKAAVAAGGTQPLYDWNGVNIGNAAGRSREIIPDGKLCSAGNDKYRGLDLARADWPASRMASGAHTFRYRGTAPHKGTFALYVTKDGYDPAKPLRWSDLEERPFATVTDPKMVGGDYVFEGTVPKKSGRHLIYSIWQRSDSPEAFYTCSDVVFGTDGGEGGGAGDGAGPVPSASASASAQPADPAPTAVAPTDAPAAGGHEGHGAQGAHTGHGGRSAAPASQAPASHAPASGGEELAETGGDAATPYLAMGGAAVVGLGAVVLYTTARRRSGR